MIDLGADLEDGSGFLSVEDKGPNADFQPVDVIRSHMRTVIGASSQLYGGWANSQKPSKVMA